MGPDLLHVAGHLRAGLLRHRDDVGGRRRLRPGPLRHGGVPGLAPPGRPHDRGRAGLPEDGAGPPPGLRPDDGAQVGPLHGRVRQHRRHVQQLRHRPGRGPDRPRRRLRPRVPADPETLMHAILTLHEKVRTDEITHRRPSRPGRGGRPGETWPRTRGPTPTTPAPTATSPPPGGPPTGPTPCISARPSATRSSPEAWASPCEPGARGQEPSAATPSGRCVPTPGDRPGGACSRPVSSTWPWSAGCRTRVRDVRRPVRRRLPGPPGPARCPTGSAPERFEVVVNLLSLSRARRVRVRVQVPESDAEVATPVRPLPRRRGHGA